MSSGEAMPALLERGEGAVSAVYTLREKRSPTLPIRRARRQRMV